jgi:hypothetical protein
MQFQGGLSFLAISIFIVTAPLYAEPTKIHSLKLPIAEPAMGDRKQEAIAKEASERLKTEKILVTRTAEDRQIAWADSCEALKAEIASLRDWQQHAEFSSVETNEEAIRNAKCTYSKELRKYQLDITDYLPSYASKCIGTQLKCDGPNCFNTAMLNAGVCKSVRFTSSEEMMAVLQSPSCKEIADPKDLKPGDTITIGKGEPLEPRHSFVYISENLGFEKPSHSKQELHRFLSPSNILKFWSVEDGCFLGGATEEKCAHRRAVAHHCSRSTDLGDELTNNETPRLKDMRERIDKIDFENMHQYTMPSYIFPPLLTAQEIKARLDEMLKREALKWMPRDLKAAASDAARTERTDRWNLQVSRLQSMMDQADFVIADEPNQIPAYKPKPKRIP